ncbi:MAG: hypothetical protein HY869_08685 [Chloroflexi bacterium]|nr:hypothetical protein [Chloroflexota bacterium]
MKKMFVLQSVILLSVLLVSACAPAAQPTQMPLQAIPTQDVSQQVIPPTEIPTQIPPTAVPPTDLPAPTLEPTVAVPQQPLVVTENDRFCLKKVPYTLIGMPETATYRMLSEGYSCSEGGIQNGQHLITCTGPMYTLFQIEVCDGGACQNFEFGTTNCP